MPSALLTVAFDGAVLRLIAEIAWEHGAPFVLDEVKTAFRTVPGSVLERIGLKPDLTHGFVPMFFAAARKNGPSAYIGDGANAGLPSTRSTP